MLQAQAWRCTPCYEKRMAWVAYGIWAPSPSLNQPHVGDLARDPASQVVPLVPPVWIIAYAARQRVDDVLNSTLATAAWYCKMALKAECDK